MSRDFAALQEADGFGVGLEESEVVVLVAEGVVAAEAAEKVTSANSARSFH